MQYRQFGKRDWKVSALGFGCMRLPSIEGTQTSANIFEDESVQMIRYAIDQGVNYVDTAYPYHDGKSEIVVGKALKDGYREKVKLATKSPVWLLSKTEDFDKYLNEQLKRLQTDYVDFYLFHALNKQRWDNFVLRLNLLERAESAVEDGRIKHIGFSFHDKYDVFKEIIDGYDGWALCQMQYNYLDTENQAGTSGLKYAASKGLPVVVMEPLLGGRLANPPRPVREIFDGFAKRRSPVDWALRWIWNQPEVSVVLSGMSAMSHVVENINSANSSGINHLASEELKLFERVKEKYGQSIPIPCTNCGYCLPCPNEVNIPRTFEIYNDGMVHSDLRTARMQYSEFFGEGARASACIQCRKCEEKCPQKILISDWMPKVHAAIGESESH